MTLKNLTTRLLSNENFKRAFERRDESDLAIRVGSRIQSLRIFMGLTQSELAEMIQTKQPNVARMESGKKLPNLKTLHKLAVSVGSYLIEPDFAILRDNNKYSKLNQSNLTPTSHIFAKTITCTWRSETVFPHYEYGVNTSDSKDLVLSVNR